MGVPLQNYVILSTVIFTIGLYGVMTRRNGIVADGACIQVAAE